MVSDLVILGALALVPVLAILLLRVNGAIAFMSLCLGSVLVTYTSSDVKTVFTNYAHKEALVSNQWIQLGMLLIPFLLTILFTRGSVRGSKNVTNFFPAVATGLLCVLLVVPLLPVNTRQRIHSEVLWHQLSGAQTAVILAGAGFSLIFLLFTHRRRKGDEEGKKGKHKG